MKRYHISNSTDLMYFQSYNCDDCRKEKRCRHLYDLIAHDKQPDVFFLDEENNPVCINFVRKSTPIKKRKKNINNLKLEL